MRREARSRQLVQPAGQRSRLGAALHVGLGLAALAGIVSVAAITATRTIREINDLPTSPMPALNQGPTPQQIELELLRVGLDPAALACAGCIAEDVTALVADAKAHLATGYEGLKQAQRDYEQAKFARDKLKRTVRSGTATGAQTSALLDAETELATKSAALEDARDDLFEAATADLGAGERSAINTVRGHDRWRFATWYKVVSREHADSIALRDALANLRINPEYGLEVDPAAQSLVEDELEKPAVANAKAAYEARFEDIKDEWELALGL